MNIMFLTNKFITGGAERYIFKKADYLLKSGHDVCVVSGGGDYISQLENHKIPFVVIPELKKNFNLLDPCEVLQLTTAVGRFVEEHRIDIIEIDAPSVLEVGIAVAYTYRCAFLLNIFLEYAFNHKHDVRLLESCAGHGCLYTLSQSIVAILSQNTGAELSNVRILPIPIDPNELTSKEEELGLGDDLFIFLAIARLTQDKAYVGVLLDEYVRFTVQSGAKRTRLVVVGDGKNFQEYQSRAEKHNKQLSSNNNKIILTGNRNDIGSFYRRSDVYIGMGTTVLEAAYYKKPVILSSTYPNHKGSIGYFGRTTYESVGEVIPSCVTFTPFSVLLSEVYADGALREDLAVAGAAKIEAFYHIDIVMEEWLKEYDWLIQNKNAWLAKDIKSFIYNRESFRMKNRKLQQLLSRKNLRGMLAAALRIRCS